MWIVDGVGLGWGEGKGDQKHAFRRSTYIISRKFARGRYSLIV